MTNDDLSPEAKAITEKRRRLAEYPSGEDEQKFVESARKQARDHEFDDFHRMVNREYLLTCPDIELLWFIEYALDLLKTRNMKLEIQQ
jgi:hypothetical protein